MSGKVTLRPQARVDLIEIADFIANDKIAAAERFLISAEASFDQLAENPELGVVGEFDSRFLRGIRRWRIKGFENYTSRGKKCEVFG